MLAGQIADGIATPLVGYFSDRTKTKYGNKITNIDRTKDTLVCIRFSLGCGLLHSNLSNIPKRK